MEDQYDRPYLASNDDFIVSRSYDKHLSTLSLLLKSIIIPKLNGTVNQHVLTQPCRSRHDHYVI